jgi:hypothetical protein
MMLHTAVTGLELYSRTCAALCSRTCAALCSRTCAALCSRTCAAFAVSRRLEAAVVPRRLRVVPSRAVPELLPVAQLIILGRIPEMAPTICCH